METCAELVRKKRGNSLPAILSSYFPSIFPVCPIYPSFYTELFLSQRGISFDQIRTNRIPWNNLTSITQGRKEFNFCSDIFFRFFFCVGNESRVFSKNREILIIISWGINFIIKERPYYDGLCENLMIMLRCKLEIRFWRFRELNSFKLIFKKVKGYSKF